MKLLSKTLFPMFFIFLHVLNSPSCLNWTQVSKLVWLLVSSRLIFERNYLIWVVPQFLLIFLAVHRQLNRWSLTHSLSHFWFLTLKSNPTHFWPLRHLIREMERHKKHCQRQTRHIDRTRRPGSDKNTFWQIHFTNTFWEIYFNKYI